MDHKRVFDGELSELKGWILEMGILVQGLIHKAVEALKLQDKKLAEEVVQEDEKVDQFELEIDERCIQLVALRQPEASDLRFIMTGMRIANDLERIGDLAEDIAWRARELADRPLLKPLIDIPEMARLAESAITQVLDAYINLDAAKAKAIWEKERMVDKLRDSIHEELVAIMSKDGSTVARAIPLLLISRHLERIVDHLTNIAEEIVYFVEAKVIKHGRGKAG
ncbi:MAG: phosphate signaling complex protein PhoU [Candidatus Margulisiibacteriota bacterium]